MTAPLKADIINLASAEKVSFNKYSGVVEWKNCVFLWVNIQISSDYPNKFLEGGKKFTWYGGSKMYEDSFIIQRLITGVNQFKEKDDVLLFVRFEKESYTCLGALQ